MFLVMESRILLGDTTMSAHVPENEDPEWEIKY